MKKYNVQLRGFEMIKKFLVFFVFLVQISVVSAQEPIKAGISFDFNQEKNSENEKIKADFEKVEKHFIELNYTINEKPLEMIGSNEVILKKKKSPINFIYSNLNVAPENYEISFSTGKTEMNSNSKDKIEVLLKKYPNSDDVLFAWAIELKNEGNLDQALEIANKLEEKNPDYALGHFLRGDILRKMEKYKEAVNEYIYTAQLNPYCADAYYNIAKILELLDSPELALDYYKTAYMINPEDKEIRDIIMDNYID